MKRIALLFLIITTGPVVAEPAGGYRASADQILRATSAKLAASKHFTFEARRHLDGSLREAGLPEDARIAVSVSRPNRINARSVSREGTRRFLADGRTLTVLDEKKGFYASVPMRGTIDELVDALDSVYGFTPPLAEFALSDPYREFRRNGHTVTDLGRVKAGGFLGLGGIECHRIGLQGKAARAELWVGVADQLPRQLVATFPSGGQLRIEFSHWNLAAANAGDFTFIPPKGAQKIEMWTTTKMNAARKP